MDGPPWPLTTPGWPPLLSCMSADRSGHTAALRVLYRSRGLPRGAERATQVATEPVTPGQLQRLQDGSLYEDSDIVTSQPSGA